MKNAIFLLLMCFKLNSISAQNKIIIFDENLNVLFSKITNNIDELNKINFKNIEKRNWKSGEPIFVYFGSVEFKLSSLILTCNSICSMECNHDQKMNLLHIANLDTLCNQTGSNNLPDGKWLHGVINNNKYNIIESYDVKNSKYEGYVVCNNKKNIILYKNGYLKSSFLMNDSFLTYKQYDTCGILRESISFLNNKIVSYSSSIYGLSLDYWPNDSIKYICNFYKGIEHGIFLSYSMKGQCEYFEMYKYGKREYKRKCSSNDKIFIDDFKEKVEKIDFKEIVKRVFLSIENDLKSIVQLSL